MTLESVAAEVRRRSTGTHLPGPSSPIAARTRKPVDYALAYARLGWHVLPCWGVESADGILGCACRGTGCAAGKHPIGGLVTQGVKDATTKSASIERWWDRYPKANIGIAVGASGIVVVDIDPRNGGDVTLEALEAEHGTLPRDCLAQTGGGGQHIVFRQPDGVVLTGRVIGPGVEIKAGNGYVIVEPSMHVKGRQYAWEASADPLDGATPAEMPEWLQKIAGGPAGHAGAIGVTSSARRVPIDDAQWADTADALGHVGEIDARDRWLKVGAALHSTGRTEARAAWDEWSMPSTKFDGAIQDITWNSFRDDKGFGNATYRTILALATENGWRNPRKKQPSDPAPHGMAAAVASFPSCTTSPREPMKASAGTAERSQPTAAYGSAPRPLGVMCMHELMRHEFKPRDPILEPILNTQDLMMVFAQRGVGKTHFALAMAAAVAAGGRFLKWHAPAPRKVLYLDGELPGSTMADRLRMHAWTADGLTPQPGMLRVFTPDLLEMEDPLPDLATQAGQQRVEALLEPDTAVIVVDNLSAWMRGSKAENEAESWLPVVSWILALRRRGIAVVLIHHAGKGGDQRGTSKKEDLLDTSIKLSRPENYDASDGARFTLSFSKARNLFGQDAGNLEITMAVGDDGTSRWLSTALTPTRLQTIAELHGEGLNQSQIAERLGVHKSTISRDLHRAAEAGLIAGTGDAAGEKSASG